MNGYGSRWVPAGNLSVGGVVSNRIVLGLRLDNPQAIMSSKAWYGYNPMRMRVGVVGMLSPKLSVYGGFDWEPVARTASVCTFTYRFSSKWKADLGWGWMPDQWIMGLHHLMCRGWVGLGFSQDPVLGSSFSFFYDLGSVCQKKIT